jgi:tetratricopeptide (TPR) repeat protein
LEGDHASMLSRKEFNKAIKLFPKSFNALDSLAEAYLTMGDKENAIKFYTSAGELNPGDSDYAKRVLQNSKTKLKELGVEKVPTR